MKQTEKDINRIIGNNLRAARVMRGWTQTQLSHALGVSFQQVQKYETGTNNIMPGKLTVIAKIFGVPIKYFFNTPDIISPDAIQPRTKLIHLMQALQKIEQQRPATFTAVCNMVAVVANADAGQEAEL